MSWQHVSTPLLKVFQEMNKTILEDAAKAEAKRRSDLSERVEQGVVGR